MNLDWGAEKKEGEQWILKKRFKKQEGNDHDCFQLRLKITRERKRKSLSISSVIYSSSEFCFVLFSCFTIEKKTGFYFIFIQVHLFSLSVCVCMIQNSRIFCFSEINDTLKTFFLLIIRFCLGMNNDHQQQTFITFIWFLIIIIIYNQANKQKFLTIRNNWQFFDQFFFRFMSVYNFELFFRC